MLLWMTVIATLIMFFSALQAYSLRDFSRRRLEEICRHRKRESRFGTILRHYEHAILAWEIVFLLSFVVSVLLGARWLQIPLLDLSAWTLETVGPAVIGASILAALAIVLPWSVSRVAGEPLIYVSWTITSGLMVALKPVLWLCGWGDTIMHRLSGRQEPDNGDAATITEEILTVVDEGEREGVLEQEARTMIHRVMELQEADVAEIMVPRTDMTCVHADLTLQEARKILLDARHSRVPVIGESTDDIIGILYAKDLLNYLSSDGSSSATLREIVREPFYVPETTGIDTLLQMMKTQHVHLAIVLDEYGGVAGLATMEDILEEIVGEIVDEFDDAETDQFRTISTGVIDVDARVHVDDVNERLKLELPDDQDYDTIGGFAFSVLGRIPSIGETFHWERTRFTIQDADKRKIVRVRIEVDAAGAAEMAESVEEG